MKSKIIASLTSFPARINTVHLVIEKILNQSVRPDKIVLYLTASQFPDKELPKQLTDLADKNSIFEIRFWPKHIRSFTKLVPALIEFPDDIIITFDDDVLYRDNIIEHLLKSYKKHPSSICSIRFRRIKIKHEKFVTYIKFDIFGMCHGIRSFLFEPWPEYDNLLTGVGGVLYPPHVLNNDILRDDIFMQICPTVDDLWFWAMAVKNKTKIAPSGYNKKIIYLPAAEVANLQNNNVYGECLNDKYLKAITDMYPIVKKRVIAEKRIKKGIVVFALLFFIGLLIFLIA